MFLSFFKNTIHIVVFLIFLLGSSQSRSTDHEDILREWKESHGTLIVGLAGLDEEDEDTSSGHERSDSTSIIKAIAKEIGVEVKFIVYPDAESLNLALSKGLIDIAHRGKGNPHYNPLSRIERPLQSPGESPYWILNSEADYPISREGWESLRVAVVNGSRVENYIKNNFSEVKVVERNDYGDMIEAVRKGYADAFVGDRYFVNKYLKNGNGKGLRVGPEAIPENRRYAYSLSEKDKSLKEVVGEAWAHLSDDEKSRLLTEWVSSSMAAKEKKPKKLIKISLDAKAFPFTWKDDEDGIAGLGVEYSQSIFKPEYNRIQYYPAEGMENALNMLLDGKVQLSLASASIASKVPGLISSEPLIDYPVVIVGKVDEDPVKELPELSGKIVVGDLNNSWFDDMKNKIDGASYIQESDLRKAYTLVCDGKADFAVANLALATPLLSGDFSDKLKIARLTHWMDELAFIATENNSGLIDDINQSIENMSDYERMRVANIWIGSQLSESKDNLDKYFYPLLLLILVLLPAIMVLVISHIRLKKEVERRVVVQKRLDDVAKNLPAVIYKLKVSKQEVSLLFIIGNSEKMFGISPRDIEHDPMLLLNRIGTYDIKWLVGRLLVSSRNCSPIYREFSFYEKGEKRWVGTFLEPRRLENGDVHWNGYWVDITAQHYQAEALSKAKNEAEMANKSMKSMLAIVSHELRTPLSVIVGIIDILRKGSPSREERYWIEQLEMTAEGQLQLLEDILDYFKIEAGQLQIHPEKINIREIVCHSVNIMSDNIYSKGVDLSLDIDSKLATCLWIDGRRLRQVLFNLISNSAKFTESGSIDIEIEANEIHDGMQRVEVKVVDTGIGIGDSAQKKLFTPFSQAYDHRVQNAGGTGLGLSICKQLMEAMNGHITLESTLDKGTTVTIDFSAKVVESRNPAPLLKGIGIALDVRNGKTRRAVENALYYHEATLLKNEEEARVVLSDRISSSTENKIRLVECPKSHLIHSNDVAISVYPLQHDELSHIILDHLGIKEFGRFEYKEGGSESIGKFKILVAEDNPVIRNVIKEQLQNLGQSVDVVDDGDQAWAMLQEKGYNIVLTDCYMPGIDGMELARRIQDNSQFSGMNVIGMTANAQKEHVSECLAYGMKRVLIKPVTSDNLLEILSSLSFSGMEGELLASSSEESFYKENVYSIEGYSPELVEKWISMVKKDNKELEDSIGVYDAEQIVSNVHRQLGSLRLFNCHDAVEAGALLEERWRSDGELKETLLSRYIDCVWDAVREIEELASKR